MVMGGYFMLGVNWVKLSMQGLGLFFDKKIMSIMFLDFQVDD
jgi:hypothetical protein